MAMKKYDLVVATGTFPDGQGGEKRRYKNIGSVMMGDKGPFLLLDRTFNPAGVPNPDDRDSVIVSCFEPNNGSGQQRQSRQQAPAQQPDMGPEPDFDDDIPF